MAKQKHSKYKNTAILFELLVRQVTADTLSDKTDSVAIDIIKEHFNKGSELRKELNLYQQLLKHKFNSEKKATALVEAVIQEHKKLNKRTIASSLYTLISEIRKHYPLEVFFKTQLNEYKVYASAYKSFYTHRFTPSELVQSKFTLIEHISQMPVAEVKKEKQLQEDAGLRNLTYKLLVEKFNTKYDDLGENQKRLLNLYITHTTNTPELQENIDRELTTIINRIAKVKTSDSVRKIKLNEIASQLKQRLGKKPNDSTFTAMLSSYELIKEIAR